MPFFIWSEGFSVGVREMDEQHKQLIEMINAIQEIPTEGAAIDTVNKMLAYATLHFQREEELLRGIHYRDLSGQLREHKAFLDKTKDFAGQLVHAPDIREQLASYLRNWLSHHILEMDMKYKHAFFRQSAQQPDNN